MFSLQPILVGNNWSISAFIPSDIDYIFNNLKEDELKEIALDCDIMKTNTERIKENMKNGSSASFTARVNNEILFSAGLYKKAENGDSHILWWVPTKLCEKKKLSYVKLACKMINMLKDKAEGDIFTYTPMWYEKNFHATKDLGFKFVSEFEIKGNRFLLSKLEVNK